MQNKDFEKKAQELVVKYFNDRVESTDKNGKITIDDVFTVWLCKILQNNKALISTTVSDGMYYEVTYNGDKDEFYLDAYKKWENKLYKTDKELEQPDKCIFFKDADCCYPIDDCDNCPNHKENEDDNKKV